MSWNIAKPGDQINGPFTVNGVATITGKLTANSAIDIWRGAGNQAGNVAVGNNTMISNTTAPHASAFCL